MECDSVSVTDWLVAGATVVALFVSALAFRQAGIHRREDQRDRLLGTLIDQLRALRIQEQRAIELQRRSEPTNLREQTALAEHRRLADKFVADARESIQSTELLHRSIIRARSFRLTKRLRDWRETIDQTGTRLPQVDLLLDELAGRIDGARVDLLAADSTVTRPVR